MIKNARRAGASALTGIICIIGITGTAAASHDTLECSPPPSMSPLLEFIDTIAELALLFGIAIASLGILTAGIAFMMPGSDYTRRAKQILKNTLIGATILLSANAIMAFLVAQLGAPFCS